MLHTWINTSSEQLIKKIIQIKKNFLIVSKFGRRDLYHNSDAFVFMIRRDTLLSESVRSVIKDNLSEITLKKIENRLFEKHHISIPTEVNEFAKLDDVLRDYFGAGAENLEKKIMIHMLSLEKSQN